MSVPLCFENILGFTRKDDDCIDGYLPEYSDSDSGLYIDELQGMSLRIQNATGGNYSIWEKFENAVTNAIAAFKVDIMAEILKTKEPARSRFFGDIGGKSFTSLMTADTYHGLRMYSDIIGGSFTLRGVSLILNVTEAVNLLIYDDYDLLYTIPVISQAGRPKYNSITPVQLPLTGNLYYVYQTSGQPYNNKLGCNCGGVKWCFNIEHPCYKVSRDKWTEWSMVGGIHGSDINLRDDWSLSREAQGLILHGEYGCDVWSMLCSEHSDWDNNPVDSAIAWAIDFKAGSFLSTYILDSEEVNRYTLLGIDGLTANMIYYEERYQAMLEFIGANIEQDRTECLKCKAPLGYKRHTQFL
jgi:hypothetical protein